MSEQAKTALLNIGTQRQGATARMPAHVIDELQRLGYLGKLGGLTRKGSIKYQLTLEDELDKAFG